jgi:3-oxoacyl-(acyl-carrier-protein) reductase
MRLKDKVAIITGAGRGLGFAMAMYFAGEGAKIAVVDLTKESCDHACAAIQAAGGTAIAMPCNVTDRKAVEKMAQDVQTEYGKIDILINNAGITRDAGFFKMTDADWDAVLDVNLKSMFICTQVIGAKMAENDYGRVVCISSLSGNEGNFGQTNYSASKAGVIGLVKSLSKELPRKGILINAIAPGFIITEMTDAIPDNVKEKIIARIPMRRGGTPEEVAKAALFLASDEASYINGQVLCVNGGIYV